MDRRNSLPVVMTFKYQSGEEIKKGDRVLFHGDPARIEFVADPSDKSSETEQYLSKFGGGVMVFEPDAKAFGRIFLPETENAEDLIFIARTEQ